ncbi:MAG TPA: hypothetical protein VLE96_04010 [Chlamydiales bacterium]|nr:hypothetical protein [Chlamydiales bacterium]
MSVSLDLNGISPEELSIENTPEDTLLSAIEKETDEIARQILSDLQRATDPTKSAVLSAQLVERRSIQKLENMEGKSNDIIQSIDLLLELSREAGKLNPEKPKLNDTITSLISQLKERGINLLDIPEGKEIDKEQLTALKSSLGTHLDKLRTEVQQIFTKMQTIIQNMSSINDTVKKMISEQSDLIRKMQERSIKR